MGKHNKTVTISINKAYIGYRAVCDGCGKYKSNQHADKREARKAGERHAKWKHPGETVLYRGEL